MREWPKDSPLAKLRASGYVPDADDAAKLARRTRGKESQAKGADLELVVIQRLLLRGFQCVQPIEVGWTVKIGPGGRVLSAKRKRKVSGDISALAPAGTEAGKGVLVECKDSPDVLGVSAFQDHQLERLAEYQAAGGVSILAWRHAEGISLMRWEHVRTVLKHGSPLHIHDALRMDPRTGANT